jgi:carboxymethylenebutenolidase
MRTSNVELQTAACEPFTAYLAQPEQAQSSVVVILQEIFGLNSNIRGIVEEYAELGYIAIAPDLFWRQEQGVQLDPSNAADRDRAASLMKGLDQRLAVEDALIAASFARALPGASDKVGAVGYCMGGKLAYLLATHGGVNAAVSYYGVAIQSALSEFANLKCPLLLHIATDDHLCPPDAQRAIKNAAASRGRLVTVLEYSGVGHAFARRGGAAFNQMAAQRADHATRTFVGNALSE